MLGNIGESYIISEEKGQARVIVLKIQAFAHSLRKLVNKAENAFVFAVLLLIHKIGFKSYAAVFSPCRQLYRFAVGAPDFKDRFRVSHIKIKVEHIVNLMPADA